MSTFLFDKIIFGPVWSRRLGESLGINLLPVSHKVCNFNCVYCECGLTPDTNNNYRFPQIAEIKSLLHATLETMHKNGEYINSITFAGNGEPTLHPDFPSIVDYAIDSRNKFFPGAKVTVLSNATLISNPDVFKALSKIDLNILKLDSAIEETLRTINCPKGNFKLSEIIDLMQGFKGKIIIQTLFLRGFFNGKRIDNTTEEEINAWVSAIEKIKPESVMIYSLARDTAVESLEKVNEYDLLSVADRIKILNIDVQVTP